MQVRYSNNTKSNSTHCQHLFSQDWTVASLALMRSYSLVSSWFRIQQLCFLLVSADCITSPLRWLSSTGFLCIFTIDFQILMITFKARLDLAPRYIEEPFFSNKSTLTALDHQEIFGSSFLAWWFTL